MSERERAVGQILSAVAVAISLVFVATEVRQNTIATRAQTLHELAISARDIQFHLSANPRLAATYFDLFRDPGPGPFDARAGASHTRADSLAAHLTLYAFLRTLENVYLQVQEGVVPQDVLTRYDFLSSTFQTEAFAQFWPAQRDSFDPGFVREFESANSIRVP